jgi:DnaJ-class molecular chaperone
LGERETVNYWKECIEEAFEEAGVSASKEQIIQVAEFCSGAHETYGQYSGEEFIPNPMVEEVKKLKMQLNIEKEKVGCQRCNGRGSYDIAVGSSHWSPEECPQCRGEGKHAL